MPVLTRVARSCALGLAAAGLVGASLVVPGIAAPGSLSAAYAAPSGPDREAVALSSAQWAKEKERLKKQRQREAKRRAAAARRLNGRILGARNTAMAQRGDAYSYGASGPNAFDCSGLIYYSYRRAGFTVPRTSGAQASYTRRIAKQDMAPGDLMFFYGSGGVYHAAVFLRWERGRALMVHAPGTGQQVQVASPWTSSWFGGTLRR